MRNFLIIITGILLLNAVLLYSGGFDFIREQFEPEVTKPGISPEVIDTFKLTLEAEVREKIGTPIEGYEPHMFLKVFPGLAASDFDGVEASIGRYVLVDGKLEHQIGDAKLVHSAAGSIPRRGMETLYRNIAARVGVDLGSGGTLTTVMRALTTP